VIHAAHHEQELPQYGGLMRKIPVTAITFGIAVFAIAGTPFFSGYYSKDLILANAGAFATQASQAHRSGWFWLLFILPGAIAFVTPFYMTRCWMLTFWGKPRNQHLYDHAHETPVLYGPLIVLAVLSVIGGYALNVRELLIGSIKETQAYVHSDAGYNLTWPAREPEQTAGPKPVEGGAAPPHADKPKEATHAHSPNEAGWHLVHTIIFWAFIVGIGGGFLVYMNGYALVAPLVAVPPLSWLRAWLYRRMFFDELYNWFFVRVLIHGSSQLAGWFDRVIVDGLVNGAGWATRQASRIVGLNDQYVVDGAVNGVADLTQELGAAVRAPQSGRIRLYVTVLMGFVALGLAAAIIIALS
jgi:NADH:ubiquinone oxidoreductase subunit 5 (subunit L)/multisubunit Na+/H+ antiporter MnhA subunit